MTSPASAGPITRPRFHCADESATAPGTSSRGTRSGSIAWNAGKPMALAQPAPSTSSVTSPGLGSPTLAARVSSPANRIWNDVVASRSVRRGRRSASAPPSGASSAVGTNPAAATSPAQPAWPVAVVTRMPTPTASIHVPMFETKAPAQSEREASVPERAERAGEIHRRRRYLSYSTRSDRAAR